MCHLNGNKVDEPEVSPFDSSMLARNPMLQPWKSLQLCSSLLISSASLRNQTKVVISREGHRALHISALMPGDRQFLPSRTFPQHTACSPSLHRLSSRSASLQFCLFSLFLSSKTLPKNSFSHVICLQLVPFISLYPDHPGGGIAPSLW